MLSLHDAIGESSNGTFKSRIKVRNDAAVQGEPLKESWVLSPQFTYITHREPLQYVALNAAIEEKFGWNCKFPEHGGIVGL